MSLSSENEAKSTKQKPMLLSLQCIFNIFALSKNVMDRINAGFMIKYFLWNMLIFKADFLNYSDT